MEFIKTYTDKVEQWIKEIDFPQEPSNLYDPLRYFTQLGGKRMRPILTMLSGELFECSNEQTRNAALSIEVFHNFTLIHDDIMDQAPLRRGKVTVHTKWNENIAILSGDVLMVKAYELLSNQEHGDLRLLLKRFNTTAIEVCEGQQMDMDFEEMNDVTIPQYIEMIRLKTSVLLGCAMEFGAIVANASASDCQNVYEFGQDLGVAFQIQDDILDLYADPDKFGKQVGGDVIANKKTLLNLKAFEMATLEQKEILRQLEQEQDLVIKVERTRQLYDQLGVREECEALMETYHLKALKAMDNINVPAKNKEVLIGLGEYLLKREH